MSQTVAAVFEGGVLRPLESLDGLPEHARVRVTVVALDVAATTFEDCVGTLPDEDAAELRATINAEFEQVSPSDWSPRRPLYPRRR